jgi:hypothetical protein
MLSKPQVFRDYSPDFWALAVISLTKTGRSTAYKRPHAALRGKGELWRLQLPVL